VIAIRGQYSYIFLAGNCRETIYKTFLAGVFRTKAVVSAPVAGFPLSPSWGQTDSQKLMVTDKAASVTSI